MYIIEKQIYTTTPTMWFGVYNNKFEDLRDVKKKVARLKYDDKKFRPNEKARYRIRDELGNILYQGQMNK